MGVSLTEELMGQGEWSVDIDHTPATYAEIWDETTRRPKKLHVSVYDPTAALIYTGVLLWVEGDERGLTIGGRGMVWHLGAGGVGPLIEDREYVAGTNKLDNGDFALGDLYWRRPSQESLWAVSGGNAVNAGAQPKDDLFEFDRKFPTRPGNTYRLLASGVTGSGTLRLRTLYEGKFDHPNLLVNPGFESGPGVGWGAADNLAVVATDEALSGAYALRAAPSPKPQLISNSGFESGSTDWTLDSEMAVGSATGLGFGSSGALICAPIPYPQLLLNPDFELGPGYPWSVPTVGDMGFVSDGTQAYSGTWVIQVGPIRQKQLIINTDWEVDATYWFVNNDLVSPSSDYYLDAGGGMEGSRAYTTAGVAAGAGVPEEKYLRTSSESTPGTATAFDVVPGESYEYEIWLRAAPNTDGRAFAFLHIPHPTLPSHERYYLTSTIEGDRVAADAWNRLTASLTIPANRTQVTAGTTVQAHHSGYYAWDNATLTRTRGNRDRMNSVPYPVTPRTNYRLSALVRSGDNQQVGETRIGVTLTGAGEVDEVRDTSQGHTDFVWTKVSVDFSPSDGYNAATPFVMGEDIVGDTMWLDNMLLEQTSNNIRTATHASFPVVPDQRYTLAADVFSGADTTRGDVMVGVILSGPGLADQEVSFSQGLTDSKWVHGSAEVRPGSRYIKATPFVRSKDTEGGPFIIDNVTLTKADNNSDSIVASNIAVIPERTYRWTQMVRSGAELQRGTVKLSARCQRFGYPDVVIDSSPMEATGDEWKLMSFDFTSPSGYDQVVPTIIATDVEGDYWYIDDGEIRDNDPSTLAYDTLTASPSMTSFYDDTTAPAGAETVRVMLVMTTYSYSMSVAEVSFARTGVTPATGNAIVADLLIHPKTGEPLEELVVGAVDCPEPIPYDVQVLNMTNRDALTRYCEVWSDPRREYHVGPGYPAGLDVGSPEDVFTDHAPGSTTPIVLLPRDMDVQERPKPKYNVEDRATEVQVIGATRKLVSGQEVLITTTAQVPGEEDSEPRTKQVSDATVDHRGYAEALASDLATKEATPALNVTVTLTGTGTRPMFRVGDWLYPYDPDAGLEDDTYETVVDGETVRPMRTRVLNRTRECGPSHSLAFRRLDGSTWTPEGVKWSEKDETRLTLGDRIVEWINDPQGGEAGLRYLTDRKSAPPR